MGKRLQYNFLKSIQNRKDVDKPLVGKNYDERVKIVCFVDSGPEMEASATGNNVCVVAGAIPYRPVIYSAETALIGEL